MPLLENLKIEPEMLKDKVVLAIRKAILSGELKPGERLVESRFIRHLKLSRAPLRDAFWVLERQGYVRMIPHRGTFVTKLSSREVHDIYQVRKVLETWAILKARENAASADLKELRGLFRKIRSSAEASDLHSHLEVDLMFHRKIWKLSGNSKVVEILNNICPSLFTYILISRYGHPPEMSTGIDAHQEILAVLLGERDSADSQKILEAQIEKLEKATLSLFVD
jgi:DNA-binding GntR family transcriptional regulator